tara:strand:- start:1157 stop:1474 length:318 start_codon:yes stop_codon:yes gene_type:complete
MQREPRTRAYGTRTIERLRDSVQDTDSLKFAAACIDARLNTGLLAKYFKVSRMTIFNWFNGRNINEKRLDRVVSFTEIILDDIEKGKLPLGTKKEMVAYFRSLNI